jgi:DNA-directed RNA polymerase subunit E'/Rpb7
MDPLFERRNLNRLVRIPASQLQKNVRPALLAQLRSKYEGVCIPEGFCQPETITILEQSLGRTDLVHSGVEYHVLFQADMCMPHQGQVWKGDVKMRSKIGIHLEIGPVQVLLPRDLHMGDAVFEELKDRQQVEFEVIGSRFQQGDATIAVLGKLKSVVAQAPLKEVRAEAEEPMLAASTVTPGSQKVVTVGPATVAPPRKRKLNPIAVE